GGGIVVQFVQLQLKLMDHLADHPEDHFLAGTLKHAFQTPPETIIVKLPDLVCEQVQEIGGVKGRPFGDSIHGFTRHQEVSHQYDQGACGREFGAHVICRKMLAENLLEPHPLENPIDERQSANTVGVKLQLTELCVLAGNYLLSPFAANA